MGDVTFIIDDDVATSSCASCDRAILLNTAMLSLSVDDGAVTTFAIDWTTFIIFGMQETHRSLLPNKQPGPPTMPNSNKAGCLDNKDVGSEVFFDCIRLQSLHRKDDVNVNDDLFPSLDSFRTDVSATDRCGNIPTLTALVTLDDRLTTWPYHHVLSSDLLCTGVSPSRNPVRKRFVSLAMGRFPVPFGLQPPRTLMMLPFRKERSFEFEAVVMDESCTAITLKLEEEDLWYKR